LALAQARPEGVYLEDLCFHAQQAAEKAVKALLIRHGIPFPYVHDLAALMALLEKATGELPDSIRQGERLTPFAVEMRYPGTAPSVGEDKYREAVELAGRVLRWAERQLRNAQR
jgi:HEPN domain-containing protein